MIVETNFAGVVDLTPQVAGQVAGAGGSVVVALSGEIDTSHRREYLLVQLGRLTIAKCEHGVLCVIYW